MKTKINTSVDTLDVLDRNYDRKYEDLQKRLDAVYDKISDAEDLVYEVEEKLSNIQKDKITGDNIYNYLLMFDSIYDVLSDMEKKQFYNTLLSEVQIFEEEQDKGQIIKSVGFQFPVFYDGKFTKQIIRDKEKTVETVVLLSKGEIDSKKVRVEFSLEDMDMSGFQKGATYEQIKAYVLEHTGLKVSSLYISQIKRKCGLDVGQNYNLSKKEDAKVPKCPPEKEAAIRDALKYFQMI